MIKETDPNKLAGLKLEDMTPCICCDKKIGQWPGLTFYRIRLERCIKDVNGMRRAVGQEMQLGPLAGVLGIDYDLAKVFDEYLPALMCEDCCNFKPQNIGMLIERLNKRQKEIDKRKAEIEAEGTDGEAEE